MQPLSLFVLFSLATLSLTAIPCKIEVKLRSKTAKKFRVDLFVPSLAVKADNIVFNGIDQNKKILVEGADCDSKLWMIKSYKFADDKKDWEPVSNITSKFFGNGWIRILFQDDLKPTLVDKVGVWNSEGQLF